jgi:hypothetical protein
MHLMNIKRLAWESTPVQHAPRPVPTTVAKPAPPPPPVPAAKPAPAPSAAAAAPTTAAPPARSWTPTSAKPTGPIAAPSRAVIAKVVERFLAQKGVPKGAGTSAASPSASLPQNPSPSPAAPAAGETPSAPKPADFVSESDVRAAMNRSERIYISPRTIVTPAARDLGNDHAVFVETDAPARPDGIGASPSRRD